MIPASPLAAQGHKQCRIPHTLTREPRGHWRQDRLLLSRLALLSHSLKTQITPGVHCGSREPRAVEAGSCLRLVFQGQTRPVLLESGHFRGQGDLREDHGLGAAPTWVGFSPRGKHELQRWVPASGGLTALGRPGGPSKGAAHRPGFLRFPSWHPPDRFALWRPGQVVHGAMEGNRWALSVISGSGRRWSSRTLLPPSCPQQQPPSPSRGGGPRCG